MQSDIYAFGKVAERLLPDAKFWRDCIKVESAKRPVTFSPSTPGMTAAFNFQQTNLQFRRELLPPRMRNG